MTEAVIDIKNLSKSYGSVVALKDFSLSVPKNSIYGLLGPNGAGKTTAIEIMLGLKKQDSGTVTIFDVDPVKNYKKIATRIGVMLQQGGINPSLRPNEALNLYASFYENTVDTKELLKRVDLFGVQTPVRRLSGGQAQSLSLALAIVGKPELVFLDEPTVGMDPNARRRTWEIINELKKNGSTVVLTTHLMDEAEQLCDEISIVANGRIAKEGKTQELLQDGVNKVRVVTDSPVNVVNLSHLFDKDLEQLSETSFYIIGDPNSKDIYALTKYLNDNNILLKTFASDIKPLEEIFIELTKGEE